MKPRAVIGFLLFLLWGTAPAQYLNILIDHTDSPEEPSIFINPKNTDQLVAGSNIRNYYYSNDGGYTWEKGILTSTLGVYGDPCVVADTNGHFYYLHLSSPMSGSWLDRIVCQKSTDGGQTWSDGSYMGLNNPKDQDKEWAVVDPETNIMYASWSQFDHYASSDPGDSSHILFSRSTDGGETWSPAVRLDITGGDCIDSDNTVEGAVPAAGPDGTVYVAWSGPEGIVFNRSTDYGVTWMNQNILVSDQPGGWDIDIPGISRANGLPVTCCDLSNGPYRGNIYINWVDERSGPDDHDVWLARSTDGGNTWSAPKRVNDDPPGKEQFFTWMTVDPVTGYLYFIFYDRRNYPDILTDVYLAKSTDGGETFQNTLLSDSPFFPHASVFFGDYTNIAAYDGIVRPIWARLDDFTLSVYTAIADSTNVGIIRPEGLPLPVSMEQNYPNPVSDITAISYKVYEVSVVSLKILDIFGKERIILEPGTLKDPGKYVRLFDNTGGTLSPGLYFYTLSAGETLIRKKMIIR